MSPEIPFFIPPYLIQAWDMGKVFKLKETPLECLPNFGLPGFQDFRSQYAALTLKTSVTVYNTCQKKIESGTASESSARPFWWTQSSDFWQIIRYPHLAKPLAQPHLIISGYRHGSQVGITIPHQLRAGIQDDTMPAHGYWPIALGSNQIEALAVLSTNPTHLPNTSICAPPYPLPELLKLDFSTRNGPSYLPIDCKS